MTKSKFPADHKLQELKRCSPKAVQPDIKNLKTLTAVWDLIGQEYGQLLELTKELVESLVEFQYSKEGKTEDAKFAELWRFWTTVHADIVEVERESVLNHEPTLARFAQRLPSHESRAKYVEQRLKGLGDGKTELEVMNAFLNQERKRQKALRKLEARLLPLKHED